MDTDTSPTTSSPDTALAPAAPRPYGALSGVLAAASAVAVGEVTAALVPAWPGPVVAIADRVIEGAPAALTAWAIDTFGTADKPLLVAGVLVVLALAAAALGVLARRRPGLALVGVVALGAVAALAGLADPGFGPAAAVPGLAAIVPGVAVLLVLTAAQARLGVAGAGPGVGREHGPAGGSADPGRRRFLVLAAAVAAGAAATGTAARVLLARFDVEAARAALTLPAPSARRDLPAPPDAALDVAGATPLFTPNDAFYRIDTALQVPRIDPATHRLQVTGMVERPLSLRVDDLLRRDLVEVPITMACVSNEVGGDLIGNAAWLGLPLRELLDEAGVSPDADQVVGRSTDGYTGGFPVAAAYDRDTLVVVGMNGEPLPAEHGFPLRLVTPGLYGYVGSTKWLAEIELTRFDRFDHYWVPRGYAVEAPVRTQSRIDVPAGRSELTAGRTPIAGVAWAPTRGIAQVEVQVDDGDWQPAELAAAVGDDTWRQWVLRWDATPGSHRIRVRATDGRGETQPEGRRGVRPDGATGWHTVTVEVAA
ncbi:molybdopterin-dependent oxidoreductase [Egicoccus halophilus]|uniref:Oxidoreductase n=1 Tax=Egicoccus halophilus TaxID=1670830 RepID=A0A8J3AGW3_9ACTN|nr:molybdopterin-dependent oxidoreductase [Egicoccus halophilus]GGI08785.1 oxidoreductase [Egicoccus halophilus]